jgi:hypothetical protein
MSTETIDPCTDFDPKTVHLAHGSHGSTFQGETCLVEASCLATMCCTTLAEKYGKAKTFGDDHPSISRVIRSYAIGLNDAWDDETRQRLRPYVTKILGTNTSSEDEETRAWMATDWLARVHTPAWLRLAGLTEHAQALESLARIVDATTARSAQPSLDAARSASDAARAAAGAAASDAAWAAAWAAARDAASDAASDAARAAAWAAAWAAARDAASDAARDAAWAAAWAAARAALRPTVELLQTSALALLDAMILVGRVDTERAA